MGVQISFEMLIPCCMLNRFSHVRLFATLWMMDSIQPGSAAHVILQATVLECIAVSAPNIYTRVRLLDPMAFNI